MKSVASLSLTPGVHRELLRLHGEGMLEPLDSEFSPGILRGLDGNKNVGLLNATLPRAKFMPILASEVLTRSLVEFDIKVAELLQTERYMIKGYAGITSGEGSLSYLHAHDSMKGIVNAVVSGAGNNAQGTTMFYTGETSAEPYRDTAMPDAIAALGEENFFQPNEGELTHFGPTEFHGEPPLPANIPRMLLVAYSYE